MAKEYKITSSRLKELERELNYLKTTKDKEIAELIKKARSFGDLSENSEYDEAKNEQAKLYGRIAEIKNIMQNATVIDDTDNQNDVVTLGCTLKVKDLESGDTEIYAIVGSQEADPTLGRISDDSPVGRGLRGHKRGDVVVISAPAGELKFEILSLENR